MRRAADRKSTRLNSSHTEIYTLSYTTLFRSCQAVVIVLYGIYMRTLRVFGVAFVVFAALAVHAARGRSEEHTSELQSHRDLHSFLHDALPILPGSRDCIIRNLHENSTSLWRSVRRVRGAGGPCGARLRGRPEGRGCAGRLSPGPGPLSAWGSSSTQPHAGRARVY